MPKIIWSEAQIMFYLPQQLFKHAWCNMDKHGDQELKLAEVSKVGSILASQHHDALRAYAIVDVANLSFHDRCPTLYKSSTRI